MIFKGDPFNSVSDIAVLKTNEANVIFHQRKVSQTNFYIIGLLM